MIRNTRSHFARLDLPRSNSNQRCKWATIIWPYPDMYLDIGIELHKRSVALAGTICEPHYSRRWRLRKAKVVVLVKLDEGARDLWSLLE